MALRSTGFPVLLSLAVLCLSPPSLRAQVVRGQLLNGENGLPLEGAIITLEGPRGEVGNVLSNAAGHFLIRATEPGTYAVRADRIGHASTTSDSFQLSIGDTVDIRLVAEVRAIQLEGLRVTGESRCEIRPEAGRAVATVWEEARKALTAASLTEAEGVYRYRTIRFWRDLDKEGRRVLSEQRQQSQQYQLSPFVSLSVEELVDQGFTRPDPEGDIYFAPDAKVLLSDPFLDTHCLNLRSGSGESSGLLGVGFEPVRGRNLPDIRGVVWLDPISAQLKRVDFTYENIDPALRSDAVGGRVSFLGLPSGNWIVTDWRIRMPTPALSPDFRGGQQLVLAGIREVGGEVDRVRDLEGNTVLEAERATLTGVVLDSTGALPLAGATVTLMGTQAFAVSDSLGRFHLPGLGEGTYAVTFSHQEVPRLAGLPEPMEVDLVAGRMASVALVAPPASVIVEAACGDQERPGGSAVLTGVITDQQTGEPLPGAVVRVLWTDYRFRGTGVDRAGGGGIQALLGMQDDGLQGYADEAGRYLACAVPADYPLTLEAEIGDLTSGMVAARVPAESGLYSRDLAIHRSGTGALVGIAVDWEDQGPLAGVRVRVEGLREESVSDEGGRFLLEDIPLGRHILRAEMLGRRSVTDTIQIRPDRPLQMEIRLPPEALAVEGITVEVLSRSGMELRTEGRAGANLDRMTPEEMDALRDNVSGIVDVIHQMGSPRIRITEYGPQGFPLGFCMRWGRSLPSVSEIMDPQETGGGPGGCQSMLIVVDGRPIQGGPALPPSSFVLGMSPEDIESVEVFSPVQAQFRFGIEGSNGALVIETRRGGRGGG